MSSTPHSQWIGSASDDAAAQLFRRDFAIEGKLCSATLYLCGLGYHEPWLNGERVGNHVLDPAQTDYERRVFYVSHDVTALVRQGPNALGVVLGHGWYTQDRVWSDRTGPGLSYGRPRLMAELRLTLDDGTEQIIRADEQWRCTPGPITDNNIYAGEHYDARLEIDGWCDPSLDASAWSPALPMDEPGGDLELQIMPPMRRIEELKPAAITGSEPGRLVVDMGQNFSGWLRIRVDAPTGTEIVMRFAETVFPDGRIDTASTGVFATGVEQIDRYTCRGEGTELWEPRFTYHGFRYAEVTGWPGEPEDGDIVGIVVHTDMPQAGHFECSDERLNQLHRMALWTHRSNAHGLPEDCPVRERCGWLGDANLVAEYSLWNFDAASFWEKFLGDIETTRAGNDGIPCNISPGKRCTSSNANPDWAAAFIMLPWYLFQHGGNREILIRHWDGMTRLMRHFEAMAEDWILKDGYGDFFDPGTEAIVMHTPQSLTSTLWFCRCAEVMAQMAQTLGMYDAAQEYAEWHAHIVRALTEGYFDAERGSFGSQGADTLALTFEILPDQEERILTALVSDIEQRDTHMNVGVMGVRYILEVLTRRGHGELALALMRQNTYPSFGRLIERGATTLWECWGESGHDGTHGARSLSHPFMGGFDNWFYNTLAGIRIDPDAPGFSHFVLEAHPIVGLDWVRAHHVCPHGRIESEWRREGSCFVWCVLVPEGSTATARMPYSGRRVDLTSGSHTLREARDA